MRALRASPVLFLPLLLATPLAAQQGGDGAASDSAAPAAPATAAVAGVVRESGSGEPLAEALVVLPERGVGTYTDSAGRFAFGELRPGEANLEVRFLDRRSEERTVTLRPHEVTEVELALQVQAVEVPGLTVEAERRRRGRMAGFHQRTERGKGHFFTREELARREGNQLHQVFRRVPGVDVVPCGRIPGRASQGSHACYVVASGREAPSFIQRGPCVPIFFVDGHRTPLDEMPLGINELSVSEIEGIEVYTGPAQTPPRFNSLAGGRCGVVVIWTRDPDTGPGG